MPISIRPFTSEWIPAVRAFNGRLMAGGVEPALVFPEHPTPVWLPRLPDREIYQEYFLAVDGDQVRGGFILKRQGFWISGRLKALTFYHGPVSEGIVNRAFASVGVMMIRAALKAEPRLFALGMGGLDQPLPTMLKALGWRLELVPFAFYVHRPAKFFTNVAALNATTARRTVSRAAAWTGLGGLGVGAVQATRARRPQPPVEIEPFGAFSGAGSEWIDELWNAAGQDYAMIGSRDRKTLSVLYPEHDARFHRVRVQRGGTPVGWAVVLDTQKKGDRHFGDLRLGSIVDAMARPADAAAVVWAARRFLKARAVDLVISNQSHHAWVSAMRSAGFLTGPSNFAFAASKALVEELGVSTVQDVYVNRGDGDGPIHL